MLQIMSYYAAGYNVIVWAENDIGSKEFRSDRLIQGYVIYKISELFYSFSLISERELAAYTRNFIASGPYAANVASRNDNDATLTNYFIGNPYQSFTSQTFPFQGFDQNVVKTFSINGKIYFVGWDNVMIS